MAQTAFYILGGVLIVVAIMLSVLGLRLERFPTSRAAVATVAALFAALVVATGAFAWIQAEEEQDEHAAELAAERTAASEERAAMLQEEIQGVDPEQAPEEGQATGVSGEQVFADAGCGSCHTLEAAGATGTVGPNLDETLPDRSRDEIAQQIVDPESEVTPGFQAGVMPSFEGQLSEQELDALVDFLVSSTQ